MIGLALEGGGVRGSYQIGAYMAFKKCGIKFDSICGTSIGSFNAAMLASHREDELMKFWYNVDTPKIFGLSKNFVEEMKKRKLSSRLVSLSVSEVTKIFKKRGIELEELKKELNEVLDEKEVRNSNIDFGLVTVKRSGFKPIHIFKDEIPNGKMHEYIVASCFLPVFKSEKLIDGNYYMDGGYTDVCPTEILYDRGCEKVYAVRLKGIGVFKKSKHKETVYITPSRDLGSALEIDLDITRRNIELGFYDTYKVLKGLDGFNYYFKNMRDGFYDHIIRREDPKLVTKMKKYFKVKTNKDVVIKAFEYVLEKENEDVFVIYSPYGTYRHIKRKYKTKDDVYLFIKRLSLL